MEELKFIGIVKLKGYPRIEIFEEFSSKIDRNDLLEFNHEIKSKIKVSYLKYLAYIIFCVIITFGLFMAGYYTYEPLFPLSVIFSIFFIAGFIYISRADEVKSTYFRFVKITVLQHFNKYCLKNETLKIVQKKNRILIYIHTEV